MADLLNGEAPVGNAAQVSAGAATEAGRFSTTGEMIKSRMPGLVKGAGYAGNGQRPLEDPTQIMLKAQQATLDLRTETARGYTSRAEVTKGLNQGFLSQFGYLKTALTTPHDRRAADRGVRRAGLP